MNTNDSNIVLIQYIVGKHDLLHNIVISDNEIKKIIGPILESARHYGVYVYLLTNANFDPNLDGLKVVHMDPFDYQNLSVYFHRLELSFKFILRHSEFKNIALVDASDVEMLNYPFDQIEHDKLYIGDDAFRIRDAPIITNNSNSDAINQFLLENGHLQMLTPGTLIGSREVMVEYLGIITKIISSYKVKEYNHIKGYKLGSFEMALSNYVAYKYFGDRLIHGRQVTTIVHAKEPVSSAWFRHK